jgi:hypothetical protein
MEGDYTNYSPRLGWPEDRWRNRDTMPGKMRVEF